MAQQQQSNVVKPQKVGGAKVGMTVKRIPDPTAKSLAGEMKNNKVFGTPNIKGALKVKAPKMPKKSSSSKKKASKSPSFKSVESSVRKTMGY